MWLETQTITYHVVANLAGIRLNWLTLVCMQYAEHYVEVSDKTTEIPDATIIIDGVLD